MGGDCIRACIASIFELELEEVPDFISRATLIEHKGIYPAWYQLMQDWLFERGCAAVEVKLNGKQLAPTPHPIVVMVYGPSKAGMHAIVAEFEDGRIRPIHDPAGPDREPSESLGGSYQSIVFFVLTGKSK